MNLSIIPSSRSIPSAASSESPSSRSPWRPSTGYRWNSHFSPSWSLLPSTFSLPILAASSASPALVFASWSSILQFPWLPLPFPSHLQTGRWIRKFFSLFNKFPGSTLKGHLCEDLPCCWYWPPWRPGFHLVAWSSCTWAVPFATGCRPTLKFPSLLSTHPGFSFWLRWHLHWWRTWLRHRSLLRATFGFPWSALLSGQILCRSWSMLLWCYLI